MSHQFKNLLTKEEVSYYDSQNGQRSYRRVAYLDHEELLEIQKRSPQESKDIDGRIIELADFLATARLPFPAADRFEYWLLDPADGSPLALIFSCTEAGQMATYPSRPEWTALPAAVLRALPQAFCGPALIASDRQRSFSTVR